MCIAWLLFGLLQAQASGPPTPADTAPAPEATSDIEKALAADAAAPQSPPPPGPVAVAASVGNQSMNPDIALILDLAGAAFTANNPLQQGGHDPTHNGFNLQQVELSLSKAVDPYFRLDAFIVFGRDGVEVEEAYATTLALPGSLQVRAGQFFTRFGRLNPTHPHAWDFVDQPFMWSRVFGGDGNRGLGAELSYLTPLPWYVELVFSSNQAAGEGTARSFYGAADGGVHAVGDLENAAMLKQFFALSDDLSLSWGLSAATGPNATGPGNRTEIYGTDLYLKYRPISTGSYTTLALQAEWLVRRREVPGDALRDTGGYAYLLWRFARRFATAVRYEYGSAPWGKDGHRRPDDLDPDWTSRRQRVSTNLTFFPTEFSRLRIQGSADRPEWLGRTNWALFLAAEFAIGAHGAHAF